MVSSNNSSTPECEATGTDMKGSVVETSAKIAAYVILFLVSLVGNSLVVAIVSKRRSMRTTTNVLIANMAASDLIISLFATPVALTGTLSENTRQWYLEGALGSLTCKLTYLLQDMSTAVSILSLVTISVDRFSAIVFPFRPAVISLKSCKIVIPVIWLSAFAIHSPYLYTVKLSVDNVTECQFNWEPAFADHKRTQSAYYIFLLAFLNGPSLIIIIVLHSMILFTLKRKSGTRSGAESRASRLRQKEDARVMKKVVIIVVVFLLCITPINVCAVLLYYVWDWKAPCGLDVQKVFFIVRFFYFSNASLNPCLYFLLYERYREGLRWLLGRKDGSVMREKSVELETKESFRSAGRNAVKAENNAR